MIYINYYWIKILAFFYFSKKYEKLKKNTSYIEQVYYNNSIHIGYTQKKSMIEISMRSPTKFYYTRWGITAEKKIYK